MFNQQNDQYVTTGTTAPVYVPRDSESRIVRPGESYFFVQIKNAQAAFSGPIWERVKSLIVTSKVMLNHPILGAEPLWAIQRSIPVQKNRAEQLGLSPNLIKLVPATMPQVSISIEFVLDKENRLATLSGLINDDVFLTAISLTPSLAITARAIGGISQKLIQTFLRAEECQPILEFSGDFNLSDGLQDGYYVLLGTRDKNNPIPDSLTDLEVHNGILLANGQRVTQLSYIILEVRSLAARTRDLNDGAAWDSKIRHAEATALRTASNPLSTQEEQRQAWQECLNLLKEAQILLLADHNYLHRESQKIIEAAYIDCYAKTFGDNARRNVLSIAEKTDMEHTNLLAERSFLNIAPDENLEEALNHYANDVIETRRILRQAEIQ